MSTSSAENDHGAHSDAAPAAHPLTLAVDIGGTGLKCTVLDPTGKMIHDRVRVSTPVDEPPDALVEAVAGMAKELPAFDRVSIGYPGAVRRGQVLTAPHFSDASWVGFDLEGAFAKALGKPARLSNDADIQGLGAISGKGIEFMLTLGTGAGTAAFRDGAIGPHLEFAHHPLRGKKSYNEYLGDHERKRIGHKRWSRRVHRTIEILESLVHYDRLYLGGGNASKVEGKLPDNVSIVSNDAGMTGGIALWRDGVGRQ